MAKKQRHTVNARFKKLTIGRKLSGGFGILLVLLCAIAVIGEQGMRTTIMQGLNRKKPRPWLR